MRRVPTPGEKKNRRKYFSEKSKKCSRMRIGGARGPVRRAQTAEDGKVSKKKIHKYRKILAHAAEWRPGDVCAEFRRREKKIFEKIFFSEMSCRKVDKLSTAKLKIVKLKIVK